MDCKTVNQMTGFKSKKEMAMSKIADLAYDIESLYIDGLSANQIAKELNCPLSMVTDWIEEMSVADIQQDPEELSPFGTVNS
jgi:hypothetical protein